MLVKQLADVFLLLMNGRQNDVARGSTGKLHDSLAQIGIDYRNAMPLQKRIEMALLGQHRLAFDHRLNVLPLQKSQDDLVMLAASRAQWTVAPKRVALASNCSSSSAMRPWCRP